MADKPIRSPLAADLPENWSTGQIVAPAGSDVGLSQRHGYNYLMKQVNAAQEAVNQINDAFTDLVSVNDVAQFGATYIQIALPKSGWSALSQTVTVEGILADETQQQITLVPALASQQEYYTAEVMVTAQGENSLTFTCAQTPASDLTVYVVVMGVTTG